jgi:hypothetical protein
MTFEDAANSTIQQTMDQGRQAAEKASQVLKDGYGAARQYVEEKGLNSRRSSSEVSGCDGRATSSDD